MTTSTSTAVKQPIPAQEPPVGTIASFHFRFASGLDGATDFLQRTPAGWSATPFAPSPNLRPWDDLTDMEASNAARQKRHPGTAIALTSIEIAIHYAPPATDSAERLAELEQAITLAAERLGIQTEGASHAELVTALENLVVIARSL